MSQISFFVVNCRLYQTKAYEQRRVESNVFCFIIA